MNGFQLMRRLQAYGEGRPIPNGRTKHLEVVPSHQALLVAFLRMGGESGPWAVGWKHPGEPAKFAAAPEPRDRELVAEMLAGEFTNDLAVHLLHPAAVGARYDKDTLPPLQQVWLAGPTHLQMLHLLAMAYAFAKKGPADRVRMLQLLGRTANFLFLLAQQPGQQMVVDATQLIGQAHAFPADDLRQAHLGFLLAWLQTKGDAAARIDAAARAEAQAVSTALDPAVDRDQLVPHVEAYNAATGERGEDGRWKRRAEDAVAKAARAKVHEVLCSELDRRLKLVEVARDSYLRDCRSVNPGVAELVKATRKIHWEDYLHPFMEEAENRRGFHPSAVTDRNPRTAAIRYLELEAAEARRVEALSAADDDLVDEILAGGEGFVGQIVGVENETDGERKGTPVWTIRGEGLPPLRLKAGDEVKLKDFTKRIGCIRSIEADLTGRTFVLEITGAKRAPKEMPSLLAAVDPGLVGRRVCFLTLPNAYFSRERTNRVRFGKGPGDWLLKDLGQSEDMTATEDEP